MLVAKTDLPVGPKKKKKKARIHTIVGCVVYKYNNFVLVCALFFICGLTIYFVFHLQLFGYFKFHIFCLLVCFYIILFSFFFFFFLMVLNRSKRVGVACSHSVHYLFTLFFVTSLRFRILLGLAATYSFTVTMARKTGGKSIWVHSIATEIRRRR